MKYAYEFIGTFFLMTVIGMVVIGPGGAVSGFAPIAIGTVLAVMIFAGGHVSGGHYNPAVSLAVFLRGKSNLTDLLIYWVVQIAAALVAVFLVQYLKGQSAAITGEAVSIPKVAAGWLPILIVEFIGTFALTFTVLNVATARATEGNSFYGWAIGMAVLTMAYAFGTISGGAFNPAVAVGLSTLTIASWANIWAYIVAQLAAGAVAAFVFKAAHPADDKQTAPAANPSAQQKGPTPTKQGKR